MTSFQISISPGKRAAGRFVSRVRRALQKAFVEEQRRTGISQSEVARRIGVHRSVINRELRGHKDITLGRVAELTSALGLEPVFEARTPTSKGGNHGSIDQLRPPATGSGIKERSDLNRQPKTATEKTLVVAD